ncbi:TadE/TadG family type IV pilus assembly protein [Paenibacillus borealis]|uniref:Pilus assembly protein TadE n=1 Tax=Paenibacillus borealis TaxID=160799 RepID=A0A089MJI3_PAEBO|nr:TadE family protein [Paenibacillus borealis]AIQ56729.1 pilus assembly protein TadE [Paenibacillus borealis]
MIPLQQDEGSFTIEASLLLPVIMCITMLLLFFSLYSYQKSMLLQVGSAAAERAAYNWENSNRAVDGEFAAGNYDPLYWRISEDGLLGSLFGTGAQNGSTAIELPGEAGDEAGGQLPLVKLWHASQIVPANLTGEMSYTYGLTSRKISAKLKKMLRLPVLDELLADGAVPEVSARSYVTEPVEFIRTVDLMRYYGSKFKDTSSGSKEGTGMEKKNAAIVLDTLH